MTDRRKNNPQTFRRDPSKGPQPLEETPVHIKTRKQNKRTGKWGDAWVRRRLGKRRLEQIRNNPAQMTVAQMAEHLKMPPHEVHFIRAKLDGITPRKEKELPPSDYEMYLRDIYESYEVTPLGGSPSCAAHYEQFVEPSKNDPRVLEIKSRPINY